MVCTYLDDLWELYLLGALSAEDAAAASEHLETACPQCLGHLRDAALTVYFLCQPVKTVRPGPKANSSLLRRLSNR